MSVDRVVLRGEILHFLGDPGAEADPGRWQHFDDGCLVIDNGHVAAVGRADAILAGLPEGIAVEDHRGRLILPGFVDCHVHYAQVDVIASYGAELLDWLERYTFPAERAFAHPGHAQAAARFFLDTLLAAGTTTASVFPTVHAHSVDAFFAEAEARGLRMLCGKVMMDRNCPDFLRDDVVGAEVDNRALIARWHNRGRLKYTLTPRFAPASTPEQMRMAARLFVEYPDLHLQSHVAENRAEVAWAGELFPEARSYFDVYDRYGLTGRRSIYGHCIWIDDEDRAAMAARGTAIAFCPTSNLFLGSGLFDLDAARRAGIAVGLATDVGAGTSYSMLATLSDAYKVLRLNGQPLNPWRGFYLATLGGATALGLEGHIGNFAVGKEADVVVLDWAGTAALERRLQAAHRLEERLFALMILGDERMVRATYAAGKMRHSRVRGA